MLKFYLLERCPVCGEKPQEGFFTFSPKVKKQICPQSTCKAHVYLTDILRLHEQVTDFGDCSPAITRFMNVTEHLLMASLIYMLYRQQPETLSRMAFMIDGPLAIFGEPAKYHTRLMGFYQYVYQDLQQRGLQAPIILGLQKTGQLVEHAHAVERYLEPGSFLLVDDAYRETYVRMNDKNNKNFGHETYYGQDFIYKTDSGRIFVFAIPYPFLQKDAPHIFAQKKTDMNVYKETLSQAFAIINYFQCDLYKDATVPIALAHRHASISLVPGGKVLDVISRTSMKSGK